MLAVVFLWLIILRWFPYTLNSLSVFIIEACWIFQMLFLQVKWSCVLFLFILLRWCIIFIYFHALSHPCILGISLTGFWCIILLMWCWILFVSTLLRNFASVFIRNTALCFLVVFLSGFSFKIILILEWVRKYSFLLIFLGRVWEGFVLYFFKCMVEFSSETIWSWVFFVVVGRFSITDLITIGLYRFFFFYNVVLGLCFFEFLYFIYCKLFNLLV